jgi:hypothetical protein
VRAPVYVSLAQIEQFITQKSCWLRQKIAEQQHTKLPLAFRQNSTIYYLGEKKRLHIAYAISPKVEVNHEALVVTLSFRQQKKYNSEQKICMLVRQQLGHFFKEKLNEYLASKLPIFSQQLNLYPKSYKIRFYKSRWGSCNSRAELNFNYLLMMVPDWVIDYVIFHELCHLAYLNHSPDFWQLVNKNFNQVAQAKQWLKQHQQQLTWPVEN